MKKIKIKLKRSDLIDLRLLDPCIAWRRAIGEILEENYFAKDDDLITIPSGYIQRASLECSASQKEILQRYGITLKVGANAVSNDIKDELVTALSINMFGGSTSKLEVARGALAGFPSLVDEYYGKALYVPKTMEIELKLLKDGATIILFNNKKGD